MIHTLKPSVILLLFVLSFVASAAADTADIRNKIVKAIDATPNFGRHDLEIISRGGVVTFRGEVSSEAAKQRLDEIASDIDGVEEVRNLVVVRASAPIVQERAALNPPPPPSDAAIERGIKNAIRRASDIVIQDLRVEVIDGIAILHGRARDHKDADHALALTLMIDGVRDIRSDLTLEKAYEWKEERQ